MVNEKKIKKVHEHTYRMYQIHQNKAMKVQGEYDKYNKIKP